MQYTAHCLERWKERIDPDGQLSISEYFDNAVFVWSGQNLDGKKADFYVNGDIIFVANSDNVLTVYRANYGFDEDMNREICAKLVDKVLELNRKVEEEHCRIEGHCRSLTREMHQVDDEISVYQAKIDELTARKNRLNEQVNELRRGVEALAAERDCQAKRLVFTLPLKGELLGRKNGKK